MLRTESCYIGIRSDSNRTLEVAGGGWGRLEEVGGGWRRLEVAGNGCGGGWQTESATRANAATDSVIY